jgi:peptidoglycan/LPS O-acetylase OafA/YrhL
MWPYLSLLFLVIGGWNVWLAFSGQHGDRVPQFLAGALCLFAGASIAVVMHADEENEMEEIV